MRIRLMPRLKPNLGWKEFFAALKPSKGNIEKYESQFAHKFGGDFATMFPHGRSGLYSLFKVWELDKAEVICPAYTCVVVPHAIVLSGNIPVFVDCASDSYNMDYDLLEGSVTEKTRVIIPTHLWGYAMDVHRVDAIAKRAEEKYGHKIYVIQDAAHSYGTLWKGELVTAYGDAAIFGSNISKLMTSVFGGMVTTKDPKTQALLQDYRSKIFKKDNLKSLKRLAYLIAIYPAFNSYIYGFVNWLERKGFLDYFTKYFDEGKIDFPTDWDILPCELEARVGLVQLNRYDELIAIRKRNALSVLDFFKEYDNIKFMPHQEGATYSHCVAKVDNRDEWLEEWRKKGVQLGILIEYSVPDMPAYLKYRRGEYPLSSMHSKHTINFPIWGRIKELELK